MADDLSVAIERLRTSTQRLNTICDTAAQTIRNTEAFLEHLHVGISAWVKVKAIPEDEEGREVTEVLLGYERHRSGNFRIVVTYTPSWVACRDDVTVRPWSECSRDDKLESFEKLPELLVELAKRVDERTAKAEQTVSAVNTLLQRPHPWDDDPWGEAPPETGEKAESANTSLPQHPKKRKGG
ncbi:MAG TPA: hypothetical protein VKE74_22340 [Gemmataceae bacterium]|nr:hypothetical protein [Gemmataceae bacterium]